MGRLFRLTAAAAVVLALCAAPALALHRESPHSIRITSGGPQVMPTTRSWGNYFAFASTTDLLRNGSTGRQVYSWNLADFDCNRGTNKRTTPCANPPRPDLVELSEPGRPGSPNNGSISNNGNWAVFDADGKYGGGVGPQAHRRQIFLLDRGKGELLQITQSSAGDSTQATLNNFGSVIVFESTAPLLGLHGPPGMRQLFAYYVIQKQLVQLTAGAGPSRAPMPDKDAQKVVFESTADLLGDGHDTGISQIFIAALNKDTFDVQLTQITAGNAPSIHAFITENKSNSRIIFESTATDLPGTTPVPGGSTIYSAPAGQGSFPSLKQHTTASFGSCSYPSVDANATHYSFICTGDPLHNGTTGNRIFVTDPTKNDQLTQLTGRGDVQGPLTHNLGQFFITFASTADTSSTGGCGPQLQMIDYFDGPPAGWHGARAQGQIPEDLEPPQPPDPNAFPPPATNYLGTHIFDLLPFDSTGGSFLEFTTHDGALDVGTQAGRLEMHMTPYDIKGEATVTVPAAAAYMPPIPIPGFGVMCLSMTADGEGAMDCDGGRTGGDLLVQQDHSTRDEDATCQVGCAEDNVSCQDGLKGPHTEPCPTCPGGTVALCNGPIIPKRTGTLSPGGMELFLPMRVRISTEAGVDQRYCTADDHYFLRELGGSLELTTETAAGEIIDADAQLGTILDSTPLTGNGVSCNALKSKATAIMQLDGVVPILDVPVPMFNNGLRDVILGVHLQARSRPLDPRSETSLGSQCRSVICTSNADCDDGNPCNGVESCGNGACLPGTPLCDDGDPCNGVESCNPISGACGPGAPPVCNDGSLCTFDTCMPGVGCMYVSVCDDGNACNGIETCDQRTGACGPGTAPICNDGNLCTNDSCDPQDGCVYTSNTASCNDGNVCTVGDQCSNGACVGTPRVCDDGNVCNGLETCNPVTGACLSGTSLSCDDGNPCTDDACDPLLGCTHTPHVGVCDDGSACTSGDVCVGIVCTGTPTVVCPDDGDPCDGAESCNPATGICQSTAPLNCDDQNVCTDDTCVTGVGCSHVNNNAPCTDNNACTSNDACAGGICTGIATICTDNDPCNGIETCNPITAACVPGPLPNCDDSDPCSTDSCNASDPTADPLTGCVHVAIAGCVRSRVAKQIPPIIAMVQNTAPKDLGGDGTQQRLGRLLRQAGSRLRGSGKGGRAASRRKLTVVERQLRTFIALVDTSRQLGKISDDLASQLIDMAVRILGDVTAMKASV